MALGTTGNRRTAARRCAGMFDSDLFKALCEPVRIDLVRLLIGHAATGLAVSSSPKRARFTNWPAPGWATSSSPSTIT